MAEVAMSPMEPVAAYLGGWLSVWWASPRAGFTRPGLYVWLGWPFRRNLRALAHKEAP